MAPTKLVLQAVAEEREAQDAKWGEQNHPDGTGSDVFKWLAEGKKRQTDTSAALGELTYRDILEEEMYEAFAESDTAKLREELIQVAAVAVAWVEKIDRGY